MKKRIVTSAAGLTATVMTALVFTGCGGDSGSNASNAPASSASASASGSAGAKLDPVTLNIMLWGDKPKQFDDVVAEFEKETKDTLNVKLNVTFTPQADYINKLKLKLSAGEKVDIAFDAPWMNMNTFIAQDNYTNLDSYFHNDKYPGLEKAFSDTFLNNNKFAGPDGQMHVYGLPLGQYLGDLSVIYYRKDLAQKYGMSDIKTYDDLLAYFDQVVKNDSGMIPFVVKNDGQYGAVTAIEGNKDKAFKYQSNLWDVNLGPNVTATVQVENGKVENVTLPGDSSENIAKLPAPFNKPDYSTQTSIREWHDKGYIEKEPIIRKDARGTFTAGKAAAMMEGLSNFDAINSQLLAGVPSAQIGVFVTQQAARDQVQPNPYMISDFRVWNFLAIPKTSANVDRAMAFLDWMFQSQDNHDLFELGIKGKNWEAVGDDKYKYPDGIDMTQNYSFPGYMMTWNPTYIRLPANVPDELVASYRYLADERTYVKSAIAGFAFNQDPVKNQMANPDFAKIAQDKLSFDLGMVSNPADGLQKMQVKWDANKRLQKDIADIKAELVKQLQAFLDQSASN